MRIIGGTLGGRVLKVPLKSWPTRPTTDIAKEALYNILANRIDFGNLTFLDLFGGTGAHSLEFLSRGCTEVTYIDQHIKCVQWMRNQIRIFDFSDVCKIIKMDVSKFLKRSEDSYNIIFADPPYALPWINEIPDLVFQNSILCQEGILIIEHGDNTSFDKYERFTEVRKYGQSRFSFFS